MQILGHFCFLLMLCTLIEFYTKILENFWGFILMDCITCLKHLNLKPDFGFGFLLFGSSEQVFKALGLFFLFGIGLKLLQIGWYYNGLSRILCDFVEKSDGLRKGLCSKSDIDVKYRSKIESCKCKLLKFSQKLSTHLIDKMGETKDNVDMDNKFNDCNDVEEEEKEGYDEEELFDVLALRKMIKIERQKAENARFELEKERMAAATAAEEAMAMILRLQNEKSLVEMEAKQYKRLAEEKQHHDQEVIQSLQWLLMKYESERSRSSDDQLRQKLKLSMQSDEEDHSEELEDALNHGLFSSLDVNLLPRWKNLNT